MSDRVQLNEQEMEQVVGGVFAFYGDGTKCKVQGNRYNCLANGQFQIITLINNNPGKTEVELVQMALEQGILWPMQ